MAERTHKRILLESLQRILGATGDFRQASDCHFDCIKRGFFIFLQHRLVFNGAFFKIFSSLVNLVLSDKFP